MSIVMMIVGLLTGGVLTGKSLIRAAQLRGITNEYNQYNIALGTFMDKYHAMPGDMTDASLYWGTDPDGCPTHTNRVFKKQTCNGDGSGRIDVGNGEIFRAWQHLTDAGLISGQYTGVVGPGWIIDHDIGINSPGSKLPGGGWGIDYVTLWAAGDVNWFPIERTGHIFFFGAPIGPERSLASIVTTEEAANLDTKMEDGKPGKGKVRSWRPGGNVNASCTNNTDPTIADYDFTNTDTACTFLMEAVY